MLIDDGIRSILLITKRRKRSIFHNIFLSYRKINGADCVDMECDGHKKVLVKDLDGTLIDSPGSIISQADFEWDGDPRRGLGDYRIPKSLLTDQNGDRIDVENIAPYKGIVSPIVTLNNAF